MGFKHHDPVAATLSSFIILTLFIQAATTAPAWSLKAKLIIHDDANGKKYVLHRIAPGHLLYRDNRFWEEEPLGWVASSSSSSKSNSCGCVCCGGVLNCIGDWDVLEAQAHWDV